jgi:hypothetical protein
MKYSLTIEHDGGNHRMFVFGVEEQTGRGWAKMRVLEIWDSEDASCQMYSPQIEYNPGHRMGHLWTARRTQVPETGQETYAVYGFFGDPHSRFVLEPQLPLPLNQHPL